MEAEKNELFILLQTQQDQAGTLPYRPSGKWHSWRGYLRGYSRQYYKFPDTKDGYNTALSEFVNWQNSLKENRVWAVEIQHHQRVFQDVEKWYSLHGIPEGEENIAQFVSVLLNRFSDAYESEPQNPSNFIQGAISSAKGTDRTQNDFIFEFCTAGMVDNSYLELDEHLKNYQAGFGSRFYRLPPKWAERIKQLNVIPNLEEIESQTILFWHDKYIAAKLKRFRDGKLSSETVRDADQKSKQFVTFLGEAKVVSQLSDENWEDYHDWLTANKDKGGTRKSYQSGAKTFMRWCKRQSKCKIRIPDNFDDPDLSFEDVVDEEEVVGDRLKELWTVEEIKTVLASDEDYWKAFILLSLNCGFLASDLNDIKHTQYDSEVGRLIHKRRKTRRKKRIPIVNYKLWPKTIEAIEKIKTDPNEFEEMFHTKGGARILTPKKSGKGSFNNLSRNWQVVRDRLKLRKNLTLRKLRNTALTELKKSLWFRDLDELWLGHAKTVSSRHYHIVDGQEYEPLDKAVDFIAEKLEIT